MVRRHAGRMLLVLGSICAWQDGCSAYHVPHPRRPALTAALPLTRVPRGPLMIAPESSSEAGEAAAAPRLAGAPADEPPSAISAWIKTNVFQGVDTGPETYAVMVVYFVQVHQFMVPRQKRAEPLSVSDPPALCFKQVWDPFDEQDSISTAAAMFPKGIYHLMHKPCWSST